MIDKSNIRILNCGIELRQLSDSEEYGWEILKHTNDDVQTLGYIDKFFGLNPELYDKAYQWRHGMGIHWTTFVTEYSDDYKPLVCEVSYNSLNVDERDDLNVLLQMAFGLKIDFPENFVTHRVVNDVKLPEGTLSDEELEMIKED